MFMGCPAWTETRSLIFAQLSQGDVNGTKFAANITKPEILIKIQCDVHLWMMCYVGVQDNPFFAVTDKDGHYAIPKVPPGNYTLTAHHPKTHGGTAGVSQTITVAAGQTTADFTVTAPVLK